MRIAEIPTDSKNRPLETVSFTACEVLWNPFDDIVPRELPQEQKVGFTEILLWYDGDDYV